MCTQSIKQNATVTRMERLFLHSHDVPFSLARFYIKCNSCVQAVSFELFYRTYILRADKEYERIDNDFLLELA